MEPFIGTIQPFAFDFAPRGWSLCQGQLLAISQFTAVFSLLGTNYGGDGRTTFGLPDLQGRMPIGQGRGAGLSDRRIGQKGGGESVTLTTAEMPSHTHALEVEVAGTPSSPTTAPSTTNQYLGASGGGPGSASIWSDALTEPTALGGGQVGASGGNQPVQIMDPYLAINFSIALQGVFPSRS